MNFILEAPVFEHYLIEEIPGLLAEVMGVVFSPDCMPDGVFFMPVMSKNGKIELDWLMVAGFGRRAMERISYGMSQATVLSGVSSEKSKICVEEEGMIKDRKVSSVFDLMANRGRHCLVGSMPCPFSDTAITLGYVRTRNARVAFKEAILQYDHSRN